MQVQINKIGHQMLSMSLDGKLVCEFIFDGDEVQVTDENGAPLLDEDKAIEYLQILIESANIDLVEIDNDEEETVQFKIG